MKRTRNAMKELWGAFWKKLVRVDLYIRWTLWAITKLPFNKSEDVLNSHAKFLIPLISSLYFALCPEAHSRHPLFSLLFPLCAATSLFVVKVSLAFVIRWIFFLFFFFLRLLQPAFLRIFFLILFMSNLIWEIHFEGRVLINKTPSNIDLLPKITRYHQRFWNSCWKIFKSVHALFLLMIYLFSFGYWKNLWVHVLYFFFLLWMLCLSKLCDISMFKSPFNLWQKIVQSPFLCSSHFGLKFYFLSLAWFGSSLELGILVFVLGLTSLELELGILVPVGQYRW